MKSRYIDSSGNEIRRSTYESFLAKIILEHPEYWQDVLDRINEMMYKVIKHNETNDAFTASFNSLYENIIKVYYPDVSKDDFIKILQTPISKSEKQDIYPNRVVFQVYKYFFERLLDDAWILPDSHLLAETKDSERITYYKYSNDPAVRPAHLFTDEGRGRDRNFFSSEESKHAGILSAEGTPKKLKNKFNPAVRSAKLLYKRQLSSPTIKLLEQYDLPFSAGPSGTIGFVSNGAGALLGDKLTAEDFKKIYMVFTAYLVYEGHHSFADIGLVIDNIPRKDFYPFKIDLSLRAKEYYDQYLTEEFRGSNAYHAFYSQHNIAFYSAMTWEILRDAQREMNSMRRTKEFSSSFYEELKKFNEAHEEDSEELSPDDLNALKAILNKHYSTEAKSEVSTSNKVLDKLVNKLKDSGILIHEMKEDKTQSPSESKATKTNKSKFSDSSLFSPKEQKPGKPKFRRASISSELRRHLIKDGLENYIKQGHCTLEQLDQYQKNFPWIINTLCHCSFTRESINEGYITVSQLALISELQFKNLSQLTKEDFKLKLESCIKENEYLVKFLRCKR